MRKLTCDRICSHKKHCVINKICYTFHKLIMWTNSVYSHIVYSIYRHFIWKLPRAIGFRAMFLLIVKTPASVYFTVGCHPTKAYKVFHRNVFAFLPCVKLIACNPKGQCSTNRRQIIQYLRILRF